MARQKPSGKKDGTREESYHVGEWKRGGGGGNEEKTIKCLKFELQVGCTFSWAWVSNSESEAHCGKQLGLVGPVLMPRPRDPSLPLETGFTSITAGNPVSRNVGDTKLLSYWHPLRVVEHTPGCDSEAARVITRRRSAIQMPVIVSTRGKFKFPPAPPLLICVNFVT